MSKLNKIKQLQEEAVSEILSDPNLSKHEKLQEISNNKLWGYEPWIKRIFAAQEKTFAEQVKAETGESFACIDDFINDPDGCRQRHEHIDMADVIEGVLENAEYDETDDIEVLTARGTKCTLRMKTEEVINIIYDWCCEHKKIGYCLDW
jgi:hypothetical protein